jgi:hypothetical protein
MTCMGYDARSGYKCQRPAIKTVIAGCVHEHIGERDLCDWHVGDVADGMMVCGNCLSADGHKCVLSAIPDSVGGPNAVAVR